MKKGLGILGVLAAAGLIGVESGTADMAPAPNKG